MTPIKTRYPQSNLAACMLPWDNDFQLDVAKFEQHIQAGLDYLANDSDWTALAHDGLLRAATEHVVRQLAHESAGLLEALSSGALTNTPE